MSEKDFLVELNQREEDHGRRRQREKDGKGIRTSGGLATVLYISIYN